MDIGVLGTGNVAHMLAADLTLSGYRIYWGRVGTHPAKSWEYVRKHGFCWLEGKPLLSTQTGRSKIFYISNDLEEIIKNVSLIFIATTANRHEDYIRSLIEYDLKNKIIVFTPGRYAGLLFAKMFSMRNRSLNFIVSETSCSPYVVRLADLGRVVCMGTKFALPFSAFPAQHTLKSLEEVKKVCPILCLANNVLETSLIDHCSIIHPISVLMRNNSSSYYGFTAKGGALAGEIDKEKIDVLRAFNMNCRSVSSMLKLYYKSEGEDILSSIYGVKCYENLSSPHGIETRYLHEDIPYGLIPMYYLGKRFGKTMAYTEKVINFANLITGNDYFVGGYNLKKLGLNNMSAAQIQKYVYTGLAS